MSTRLSVCQAWRLIGARDHRSPVLAAAGLLILLIAAGCRREGSSAPPQPCCNLTVRWRAPLGSPLYAPEFDRVRLEDQLAWVADHFRPHGICLSWEAGEPLPSARLFVGGRMSPTLEELEKEARSDRPTLLLVDQLLTWEPQLQQHVLRKGATPGVGAAVAVVRYQDGGGDGSAIRNELLHVLGLSDAELGASASDGRHRPQPPMWQFMRDICAASGDPQKKRVLVVRKEECLRLGAVEATRCYQQ